MNFTATNIYTLVKDKDLAPGKGVVPEGSKGIKALHCISRPSSEVVIRMVNGQVIKFPSTSFVAGAIYPYSIRQINEAGAGCFLGLSD